MPSKKNRAINENIDLLDTILNIWKNKIKILLISGIFMTLLSGYLVFFNPKLDYFQTKTDIEPISTFEEKVYTEFNSIIDTTNFFKIDKSLLFNLFIEKLNEKTFIKEAIIELKILKEKDYNNRKEFMNAVINKTKTIDINPTDSYEKWTIVGTNIENRKEFIRILKYAEKKTNLYIKDFVTRQFNSAINIKKIKFEQQLEDLEKSISTLKQDYEEKTNSKLIFLLEQSSIARSLNIEKNTLVDRSVEGGLVANIQIEMPYYLRGYQTIDKEIDILRSRQSHEKDAFTEGLLNLNNQKRAILDDNLILRTQSLFSKLPLVNETVKFSSGRILINSTKYFQHSIKKSLYLSFFVSLIIGIFYVLFINAVKNYRDKV